MVSGRPVPPRDPRSLLQAAARVHSGLNRGRGKPRLTAQCRPPSLPQLLSAAAKACPAQRPWPGGTGKTLPPGGREQLYLFLHDWRGLRPEQVTQAAAAGVRQEDTVSPRPQSPQSPAWWGEASPEQHRKKPHGRAQAHTCTQERIHTGTHIGTGRHTPRGTHTQAPQGTSGHTQGSGTTRWAAEGSQGKPRSGGCSNSPEHRAEPGG